MQIEHLAECQPEQKEGSVKADPSPTYTFVPQLCLRGHTEEMSSK